MRRLFATASLVSLGYGLACWVKHQPQLSSAPAQRSRNGGGLLPRALPVWESVRALDPRFQRYMLGNSRIELLWRGARWAEGPVWCADLGVLVFSDIPNDRLLKYDAASGRVSVLRHPAGYPNGNARDRQGRLLTCGQDTRAVVRTEPDGSVTVLADTFAGRRLNGPNDVAVRSDGTIWFTDPGYGLGSLYESGRQGGETLPRAVYRLDPGTGALAVASREVVRPNGLAFSPDEKLLYVTDSGITDGPDQPAEILAHDVGADGTLTNRRVLFDIKAGLPAAHHSAARGGGEIPAPGVAPSARAGATVGFFRHPIADGIKVDVDGNVWAAIGWGGPASDGVSVIAPDGTLIGRIAMPEPVGNLAFGGAKRNRLFMTAGTALYAVHVNVAGAA